MHMDILECNKYICFELLPSYKNGFLYGEVITIFRHVGSELFSPNLLEIKIYGNHSFCYSKNVWHLWLNGANQWVFSLGSKYIGLMILWH